MIVVYLLPDYPELAKVFGPRFYAKTKEDVQKLDKWERNAKKVREEEERGRQGQVGMGNKSH